MSDDPIEPAAAATTGTAGPAEDRTIVLIGLMGAGKSAVGRRLAQRLGLPFRDADNEIEAAAGCSIADIFELHGEAAFRDGERRVIARLLDGTPHVLATGGGAWMDADTRAKVADCGVSVWLRASFEVLRRRVARRNDRPLLRNQDHGRVLKQLMQQRYPVYAQADIVVDSADGPLDDMVTRVANALATYRSGEPEAATPAEAEDQRSRDGRRH